MIPKLPGTCLRAVPEMKATKGGKLGVGKLRVDTRKTKKLTHNFQKLKLSDESYDKALEEVEEYFCKTHAETPNDHLIRIPLTINSIKVLAVLDTYATLSVLDPTLVSDLNLPLDGRTVPLIRPNTLPRDSSSLFKVL